MERYVMGWSQADNGWMVVYADDLEEAEAKFENGEFTIEEEVLLLLYSYLKFRFFPISYNVKYL